ncbi:hypothetical protein CYY_008794 [Polysphondylium violaceum]|uniref:CDP-alcohol phosphatidyltransferase n=1 Tax=Polysphondylium violaceum TaxID=133409 RepID=A0A8J4V3K7_9MYCE|nr:hypothetical protein CYY_008794 [Polysphondylium violaceum]
MDIIFRPYVSKRAKENIKNYKYSCSDNSISNMIMQPFWNWSVNFLPMSLAPNSVTSIGLLSIIISYLVTLYYMPEMKGTPPTWLYYFNIFSIFFYQTMDALDGKQARRTQSSSGLGELFDHGCDAIITFFVVQTFQCSLQIGINEYSLFSILAIMFAFYTAQWEQYHTDVMTFGVIGVVETHFVMIIGHLITAIVGPHFWLETISISKYITLQYNHIVIIGMFIGSLSMFSQNAISVFKKCGKEKALSCLQDLIPVVVLIAICFIWNQKSGILYSSPHLFMSTFGYLMAFITGRLILARICGDRLFLFQNIMLPLALVFINFYWNLFDEVIFLKYYFIFVLITYLHFCYVIITTLSKVLGIKPFKVRPKSQ